jgi:hypothetical protein
MAILPHQRYIANQIKYQPYYQFLQYLQVVLYMALRELS